MLYFAYGSNLSTVRMRMRVPSCRVVTTALLKRHRLAFHKIGMDGSAKCDAVYTGKHEDQIYGTIYKIDPTQKQLLDAAEGLGNGYDTRTFDVQPDDGPKMNVFFYAATAIDPDRKPFRWYKEHVLSGMKEHGFPKHYLAMVEAVQAIEDPDPARHERELLIYTRRIAGKLPSGERK